MRRQKRRLPLGRPQVDRRTQAVRRQLQLTKCERANLRAFERRATFCTSNFFRTAHGRPSNGSTWPEASRLRLRAQLPLWPPPPPPFCPKTKQNSNDVPIEQQQTPRVILLLGGEAARAKLSKAKRLSKRLLFARPPTAATGINRLIGLDGGGASGGRCGAISRRRRCSLRAANSARNRPIWPAATTTRRDNILKQAKVGRRKLPSPVFAASSLDVRPV